MKKTIIHIKIQTDLICFLDETGTKFITGTTHQTSPKKHKRFVPLVLIESFDDKGCTFRVDYNKITK